MLVEIVLLCRHAPVMLVPMPMPSAFSSAPTWTPQLRALALAATFLIDFLYFEDRDQTLTMPASIAHILPRGALSRTDPGPCPAPP